MMTLATRGIQPIGDIDKIQQIIAALHDFIVEGDLQEGTELPSEKELATTLRVSRFSLREALRVAQAQGLIEISRGRKPRVAAPSAAAAAEMISLTLRRSKNTLLDLADARLVLETHVAAEAATRASEDDVQRLQETIEICADESSDAATRVAKDVEFHSILVKASGNVVFEIMLAPLAGLLRASLEKNYRNGAGIEGHIAVLDAIRSRDPSAAAAAMRAHLEFGRSMLEASLSEEE
jgi:GntR family transcriptional regulator, transcriptional repressor for pyruvate dehydrogenase complex